LKLINCTVVIKDGGFEKMKVTPEMFGELAYAIQEKGSETVRTANNNIYIAAGIFLLGKEAGDRIIYNTNLKEIE
jgi:hypothetical protein